nr:hypothetical protein [Azospirillum sp. TSH58]
MRVPIDLASDQFLPLAHVVVHMEQLHRGVPRALADPATQARIADKLVQHLHGVVRLVAQEAVVAMVDEPVGIVRGRRHHGLSQHHGLATHARHGAAGRGIEEDAEIADEMDIVLVMRKPEIVLVLESRRHGRLLHAVRTLAPEQEGLAAQTLRDFVVEKNTAVIGTIFKIPNRDDLIARIDRRIMDRVEAVPDHMERWNPHSLAA